MGIISALPYLLLWLFGGVVYVYVRHQIKKYNADIKSAVQIMSNVEELIREIRKAPDVDWRSGIADAYDKLDRAEKVIEFIPVWWLVFRERLEARPPKCSNEDVEALRETLDRYNSMYSGT